MQARGIVLIIIVFLAAPFWAAAFSYAVPFTSQAPFGNWASPCQDFCEEAPIVMTTHYIWNSPLTPQVADKEMRTVQQFEDVLLRGSKDISAEDAALVLKNLYGFRNVAVKEMENKETFVAELQDGRIVIVPVAGRMLKNPYFNPPGPLYHMLVVRGYDSVKKEFITNDPGTKRGNELRYK